MVDKTSLESEYYEEFVKNLQEYLSSVGAYSADHRAVWLGNFLEKDKDVAVQIAWTDAPPYVFARLFTTQLFSLKNAKQVVQNFVNMWERNWARDKLESLRKDINFESFSTKNRLEYKVYVSSEDDIESAKLKREIKTVINTTAPVSDISVSSDEGFVSNNFAGEQARVIAVILKPPPHDIILWLSKQQTHFLIDTKLNLPEVPEYFPVYKDRIHADVKEEIRELIKNDIALLKRSYLFGDTYDHQAEDIYQGNPYKGLESYKGSDEKIFYGRWTEIMQLGNKIGRGENSLTILVGASGSGKTSLIQAGVVPYLQKMGQRLEVEILRVGKNPLAAVAKHIKSETNVASIRTKLEELCENQDFLLVFDQFEELYTSVKPIKRAKFAAFLKEHRNIKNLRIVLCLRSDFFHLVENEWANELNKEIHTLAAPSELQLAEIISEPIKRSGKTIPNDDVRRLLKFLDAEKGLGILPLLSVIMERCFKEAGNNSLVSVPQDISNFIDKQFAPYKNERYLNCIFKYFVSYQNGTYTRRRVEIKKIEKDDVKIVEALASPESRLLLRDDKFLEIAHEKLFELWTPLKKYLKKQIKYFEQYSYIKQKVSRWKQGSSTIEKQALRVRLSYLLSEVEYQALKTNEWLYKKLKDEVGDEYLNLPKNLADLIPTWNPTDKSEEENKDSISTLKLIGDRLASLGDPRDGVGLKNGLPDIVWCPVGSTEDPDFYIAKYPITVMQFEAFTKSYEANYEPYHKEQNELYQQNGFITLSNAPRTQVNWYGADEFARWLDYTKEEKWHDWQIRLPEQEEWKQALGQWDFTRGCYYANSSEHHLNLLSVGLFYAGRTQCGAMDMVGNVSEWLGSSSAGNSKIARSSYADDLTKSISYPSPFSDISNADIGFRLVLVPRGKF